MKLNMTAFMSLLKAKGKDSEEIKMLLPVFGIADIDAFLEANEKKVKRSKAQLEKEAAQKAEAADRGITWEEYTAELEAAAAKRKADRLAKQKADAAETARLKAVEGKVKTAFAAKTVAFLGEQKSASELACIERELAEQQAQVAAMVGAWVGEMVKKFGLIEFWTNYSSH